jgi:hypothetical protein
MAVASHRRHRVSARHINNKQLLNARVTADRLTVFFALIPFSTTECRRGRIHRSDSRWCRLHHLVITGGRALLRLRLGARPILGGEFSLHAIKDPPNLDACLASHLQQLRTAPASP